MFKLAANRQLALMAQNGVKAGKLASRASCYTQRNFSQFFKRFNEQQTPAPEKKSGAGSWLLISAAVAALAGVGYYIYRPTSKPHGKKLASVATASYVMTHENPEFKEEVHGGKSSGGASSGAISSSDDGLYKATTDHKSKEEYQQVYNAIAKKIEEEDEYDGGVGYGPILVRLAWHASGTYDKDDKSEKRGGNYGGTMQYDYESNDPGNNGLIHARKFLEPIHKQFDWISRGDLFSLAGVVGIQEMSGPKIDWRPGRQNLPAANQPPHGRLPDASQGATHVREVFKRLNNFTDEETVALIGVGHTIGKCHKENTGYEGPWSFSPNMVTNQFFDLLVNEEWQIKKWDGQTQFEDKKTQSLMMLPTDFALVFDPKFKKISQEFAKDEGKLFNVFAGAFARLLELGTEFPKDQEVWHFKTLEEQDS